MRYFKGVVTGKEFFLKADNEEDAIKELALKEIDSIGSFTMLSNERQKFLMIFFNENEDKFVIRNGLESYISLDSFKSELESKDLECYYLDLGDKDNIEINGIIKDEEYTLTEIIMESIKSVMSDFYDEIINSLLTELTEKEYKKSIVVNNFK
ncbi:hypothetical protein [Staphylococcus phage LY01]|nr:hypothetical protein [Staphylococcus phage LY01]